MVAFDPPLTQTVLFRTAPRRSRRQVIPARKRAEEARAHLPELLDAAERGETTIVTRHGKDVAAIVSIDAYQKFAKQASLLPLAGTMRGYWGEDSANTIRELHDEWER